MMKIRKILLTTFMMLVAFIVLPNTVNAASGITVSCKKTSVPVNGTATCYITAKAGTVSADFKYELQNSGLSKSSGSKVAGGSVENLSKAGNYIKGSADFYAANPLSKNTTVLTLTIKTGKTAGTMTLRVYDVSAWDANDKENTAGSSVTITITTTTTTTKKSGVVTAPTASTVKTSKGNPTSSASRTITPGSSSATITFSPTGGHGTGTTATPTTRAGRSNYIDPDPNHTTSVDSHGNIYYETTGPDGSYTRQVGPTTAGRTTNQHVAPTTRAAGQNPGGPNGTAPGGNNPAGPKTARTPKNGSMLDNIFGAGTTTTKIYYMSDYNRYQAIGEAAYWHTTKKADKSFSLTNIKVLTDDGYATVYEIDGIYYSTVGFQDEVVEISADVQGTAILSGDGKRTLTTGRNLVLLRLANIETGEVLVYQLVIIRDDGSGVHDTSLRNLEVVGFDIDFDPEITEYTLFVPYTMTRFYVDAAPNNEDMIVLGKGIYSLKKDNDDNIVYVSCSYGDIQSSQYAIHIKRTYKSLIPWIIAGILLAILIGLVVYFQLSKKKMKSDLTAEKDKEVVAAKKRALVNQTVMPNMKINGSSTTDVGRRTVVPTAVPQQPGQPLHTAPQPGQPRRPISAEESHDVMEHKVKPKYVVPQPIAPQQPGQPTNVKTIRTVPANNAGPYQEESVVVTQLNR